MNGSIMSFGRVVYLVIIEKNNISSEIGLKSELKNLTR